MVRSRDFRSEDEKEWKTIQDEYRLCSSVCEVKGVRKNESKLLHVALQKTLSKIKMLDWQAHATGVDEEIEHIVTQALINIAEKGGFIDALKTAMHNMALYGDAFIHIYIDKSEKYPIRFKCPDIDRVYIDPFASALRSNGGLRTADEVVIAYDNTLDSFESDFEDYPNSKKVAIGNLPGIDEHGSFTEPDNYDEAVKNNSLQTGYYYKRSKKKFGIIAGGKATELLDSNDDYPFTHNGKPDFPLVHLKGWKKAEGFYHYALGHLLTTESRSQRRVQNWSDWNMERNVKGLMMVDVPLGKAGEFWQKYRQANIALANGRDGIITMERGIGDNSQMQINKFASDPVSNELERFNDRHDRQIKRLGIPLDEIDRSASESATQTLAEETRADLFAQEFMRSNAPEVKFVWETIIELVKEFISKNDDTVIELTTDVTDIELSDGSFFEAKPTMGWLKDELTKENYFIKVKELSGVIKSPTRELSEIQTLLPLARTPQQAEKLISRAFRVLDKDDVKKQSSKDMFPEGVPEGGMKAVPNEGMVNPDAAKKFLPNPA